MTIYLPKNVLIIDDVKVFFFFSLNDSISMRIYDYARIREEEINEFEFNRRLLFMMLRYIEPV